LHFTQVGIAAAITLQTAPDEMFSYVQMWKLAPYIDESLKESLISALKADSSAQS
jgi:hypothetical protein